MKLLLDTHTLLWWLDGNPTLSSNAYSAIRDTNNQIYVSAISIVEIKIKEKLGKLQGIPQNIKEVLNQVQIKILDLKLEHAVAIENLPTLHGDPFDWMLIVQAQIDDMTFVTRDRKIISHYKIPTIIA